MFTQPSRLAHFNDVIYQSHSFGDKPLKIKHVDVYSVIKNTEIESSITICGRLFKSLKNSISCLISRIKKCFSGFSKKNHIKKMPNDVKPQKRNPPENIKPEPIQTLTEPEITHLLNLRQHRDIKYEILKNLNNKTFLSCYRTNKDYKNFIEVRLKNKLKKAQLEEQAFNEWKKFFDKDINSSNYGYCNRQLTSLGRRFISDYAKETVGTLKNLFLGLNESLHNFTRISPETSKACLFLDVNGFSEIFRKGIKKHDNKSGNHWYIKFEYLLAYAFTDPIKSFNDYKGKLSELIPHKDYKALISAWIENHSLEIFEITKHIKSEEKKTKGLRALLANCHQLGENAQLFIQNILLEDKRVEGVENSSNSYLRRIVLKEAALAYCRLGHGEKSLDILKEIKNLKVGFLKKLVQNYSCEAIQKKDQFLQEIIGISEKLDVPNLAHKNALYLDVAKVYDFDSENRQAILDQILKPNDDEKIELAKIYFSFNQEEAQKIADQIQNVYKKTKVLLKFSDKLKFTNPKRTQDIWDIALQASKQNPLYKGRIKGTRIIFEIVRQMAAVDLKAAKSLFENQLKYIIEHNDPNTLPLFVYDVSKFISVYALIDINAAEIWLKKNFVGKEKTTYRLCLVDSILALSDAIN